MKFSIVLAFLFFSQALFHQITQNEIADCIAYQNEMDSRCSEVIDLNLVIDLKQFGKFSYYLTNLTGKEGETKILKDMMEIEISYSKEPKVKYGLVYFKSVPYSLTERIVKVNNLMECLCKDESTENEPTCGWHLGTNNQRIPDSQGFCCCKSYDELLTTQTEIWRGEGSGGLNEKSTIVNYFSTAHCLNQSELIFFGYEIEDPQKDFNLEIKITHGDWEKQFIFDYPVLAYKSIDDSSFQGHRHIKAELIGDFTDFESPPDFSNKYFFRPDNGPVEYNYILSNPSDYYAIIYKDDVTVDGSEANKIGVDYTTFRTTQAATCSSSMVGDGIQNQLINYHNDDVERENLGYETVHFIRGIDRLKNSLVYEEDQGQKLLFYSPANLINGIVDIAIDLDDTIFVEDESYGIISKAQSAKYEPMSRQISATVEIFNYVNNPEVLSSNFVISVSSCSKVLDFPVSEKAISLERYGKREQEFDFLFAESIDESDSCVVTLKDAKGTTLDAVSLKFDNQVHKSSFAEDIIVLNENEYYENGEENFTDLGNTSTLLLTIGGVIAGTVGFVFLTCVCCVIAIALIIGIIVCCICTAATKTTKKNEMEMEVQAPTTTNQMNTQPTELAPNSKV